MPKETLEKEAQTATRLLKGKVVRKVWRHRVEEVGIQFEDDTRLYIDHEPEGFDFSVTGGYEDEDDES